MCILASALHVFRYVIKVLLNHDFKRGDSVWVYANAFHITYDSFMICADILKIIQDVFHIVFDAHFISWDGVRV